MNDWSESGAETIRCRGLGRVSVDQGPATALEARQLQLLFLLCHEICPNTG